MEATTLMVPSRVERTGVRRGLLEDLCLKVLYLHGEMSLVELSNHVCLSLGVIEEIFQFFRKEQLIEVKGMAGGIHRVIASEAGRQRAAGLLQMNQYAGPAPVSLADYTARVGMQTILRAEILPADVDRAYHSLVVDQDMLTRLGAAIVSGTSIFLYGPPGTGKTSIAGIIPAVFNDNVWIPHAVEVDSQIISVFDPGVHQLSSDPIPGDSDGRWVLCRRPCVLAGGELSSEMLDLQYSSASRFYTAPLQMKANNGVLLLDDFGRQRMRPDELLNRWMTPLDRRIDFLSLPGGRKFEIPFDVLVTFSTNIEPLQLADEAFLRRIPNKIQVAYATSEQFQEIFRRECRTRALSYEPGIPEYLVKCLTEQQKQPLLQCHPRDLLNQIFWAARYSGGEAKLTEETLNQACRSHFLAIKRD